MPRNRIKDYKIRDPNNTPVAIDDYRQAPWRQTYAGVTIDFRRWLYVGRPELADDGSSLRNKNSGFNPLEHAGRDGMVEAIRDAVWKLPSLEAKTKCAYSCELKYWFEFLDYRDAVVQPIYELADIDRDVIQGFIRWLKFTKETDSETGRLSYNSIRKTFSCVKSVIQSFVHQGILPEGLFPRNPFPHSNRAVVGHKPYPKILMTSLMAALYQDIRGIREGTLQLNECDVLALYLLAIAARAGRNTTPLLELTRDAVMPHPIKPDKLGLLVTYKRRGRKTSVQAFARPQEISDMISLPMDVLTLYRDAVSLTEPLAIQVPQVERKRLWLYRKAGSYSGEIGSLTEFAMAKAVQRLVKRHGLNEDGKPLRLNISRLRKTFAQRIWQLSGGDLIATAEQLGNTPPVAGQSYVAITPEMVANFRRLGILMHADWSGKLDDLVFLEDLARETGIPLVELSYCQLAPFSPFAQHASYRPEAASLDR